MPPKLEELLRRFVARKPGEGPPEALARATHTPVVINGMAEMLTYLSELSKRVEQCEQRLSALEEKSDR
jgi:hypothetical protein